MCLPRASGAGGGTSTSVVLHTGFHGPGGDGWQQVDDVSLVAL